MENYETNNYKQPTTIGQWLGRLLLMCVPVVNIIFLIIWALDKEDVEKANFAKAYLIICAISAVIGCLFGAAFTSAIVAAVSSI